MMKKKLISLFAAMTLMLGTAAVPSALAAKEDAKLWIEGEAIGGYETVNSANCSGGEYARSIEDIALEFDCGEAGLYNMVYATSADVVEITLNGSALTDEAALLETNGAFSAYQIGVTLEEGMNAVCFSAGGDGMTLDYLAFEQGMIFIEGESLAANNPGKWVIEENPKFSGGAFLKDEDKTGEISLEFTAAAAGEYTMRYVGLKSPELPGEVYLHNHTVTLNGKTWNAEDTMGSAIDGAFANYATVVHLNAGVNSLAFTADPAGRPNGGARIVYLDYVSFEPVASKGEAQPITVEAKDISGYELDTYAPLDDMEFVKAEGTDNVSIQLNVEAAAAGSYKMRFRALRYPEVGDQYVNKFSIGLNGAEWDAGPKMVSRLDDTFADYEVIVNLHEGANTLNFKVTAPREADGQKLMYLNQVTFEPIDPMIYVEGETLAGYANEMMKGPGYFVGKVEGAPELAEAVMTARVYVPWTGRYKLKYRGLDTDPGKAYVNPHKVKIGDQTYDSADIKIANANDPYAEYEAEVTLQEGGNAINFVVTEGRPNGLWKIIYLDYLSLTPIINVDSATLAASKSTIQIGEQLRVNALNTAGQKLAPELVDSITYSSSDENIAAVNDQGVVTGVNLGSCDITVTVQADGRTYMDSKKFTVISDIFGLKISEAKVQDGKVLVKYVTTCVPKSGITLIVGRFDKANGVQSALREMQTVSAKTDAVGLYQTVEIPMDSVSGNLELFAWDSIDDMNPVYCKVTVQE